MKGFEQVIGHEAVIEHLQNAIQQKKVSHGYILCGEKGSGKKLISKLFAKALQCEKKGNNPCGTCKSCLQTEGGNQPDIIYVTHEKASIGVDDIREQINHDIVIKPFQSEYKIYIIPEAEKMTEQAQNALLKTIEEPPHYGIIILLVENVNRLLPTVLSRCITLQLKSVAPELIEEYLMKECHIPDYLAQLSANFSQGNVGKAIRYASGEEFIQLKDQMLHLLKYIDDMEIYEILEALKAITEHKSEINDAMDLMLLWYRDVLMFKVTNDPNVLLFTEEFSFINRQASNKTYEGIETIIEAIEKARIRLKANVNFDTAVELMLFTLKENGNGKNHRSEI